MKPRVLHFSFSMLGKRQKRETLVDAQGRYLWDAHDDKEFEDMKALVSCATSFFGASSAEDLDRREKLCMRYHDSAAFFVAEEIFNYSYLNQALSEATWQDIDAIWTAYHAAGREPPPSMLKIPWSLLHLLQNGDVTGIPTYTSLYAKWIKIIFQAGWEPWSDMLSLYRLPCLHQVFPFWFDDDPAFCEELFANMSLTSAASFRRLVQEDGFEVPNRPDILAWVMHARFSGGKNVFRTDAECRQCFPCFFNEQHPFSAWYQKHHVEPQKVTMLLGAFHNRVGGASALYRQFTMGLFGERHVMSLIWTMAFPK